MSILYSHPLLPSILLSLWSNHFLPFTSLVFSPCLLVLNVFVCGTVVPWRPWFHPRAVPPNTTSSFQDFWQSLNDNIISVNSITIQFPIGIFLQTIAVKGHPINDQKCFSWSVHSAPITLFFVLWSLLVCGSSQHDPKLSKASKVHWNLVIHPLGFLTSWCFILSFATTHVLPVGMLF